MWHFLACYDVTNDRRRKQIERLLKGHGHRVQKSVFEICISIKDLEKLLKKSVEHLEKTDSLRVYRVCSACRSISENVGKTEWQANKNILVV
ncbi:MAG: CRISPR-associated endonuclease Cas2 [Candidatus Omnitrophota bacterium]|jgi:CRISPR-associated protein Cas2|nr:MAG: CRISPR-associated endonuclease Cas2 [Candidatus Omnitrophota bacterium]